MTADEISVTVVIPARNEEDLIETAVQSVVDQMYPRHLLECVVVDNGSTDGTRARVLAAAERHRDIPIRLVAEPEPGVGRAKNQGAAEASGDILLFLDADSRLDETMAGDVAARYLAGSPAGSIRIDADSTHPIDRGFFALMEVGKILFGVRSQMSYIERTLFKAIGGFQPDLYLAEDLDLLRRARELASQSGGTVCHIRSSAIRTSPRRLHTYPFHLAVIPIFVRWSMAFAGYGRRRHY